MNLSSAKHDFLLVRMLDCYPCVQLGPPLSLLPFDHHHPLLPHSDMARSRPRSTDPERAPLLPPKTTPTAEELRSINVYTLIHQLHADAQVFDSALSWDQINAPDINFSIIRPLLAQYTKTKNPAISRSPCKPCFCLLRLAPMADIALPSFCISPPASISSSLCPLGQPSALPPSG